MVVFGVDDDCAAFRVNIETFHSRRDDWVGRNAHSNHNAITVNEIFAAFHWHRAATTRSVRLAEFHLLNLGLFNATLFVGDVLYRIVKCHKLNAFLFCVVNLFETCGHLALAAAIDNHSVFCAETLCGTY